MRVRRLAKARRQPLPELVRVFLETGDYSRINGPGWFEAFMIAGQVLRTATQPDRDRECPEWIEWGEEIVRDWIARYPGRRPYAWWLFTASAPRRVLAGAERIRWLLPARPGVWKLHHGVPFQLHEIEGDEPILVESQPDYLRRLDLLTEAERRVLADEDFEPEEIDDLPLASEIRLGYPAPSTTPTQEEDERC